MIVRLLGQVHKTKGIHKFNVLCIRIKAGQLNFRSIIPNNICDVSRDILVKPFQYTFKNIF